MADDPRAAPTIGNGTADDYGPAKRRITACRRCGAVGLLTVQPLALDFAPWTRCGDPLRCGERVDFSVVEAAP